jgi:Proprotein convertase P-domain/Subtilase family
MRRCLRFFPVILAAVALVASGLTPILRQASAQQGNVQKGGKQQPTGATQLGPEALRQINALLAEKQSRTPEQRKVDSRLIQAMRAQRGEMMTSGSEVRTLRSARSIAQSAMSASKTDSVAQVLVDIKAAVSKGLVVTIEDMGGQIKFASESAGVIRALVPLNLVETLASDQAVKTIRLAVNDATTHRRMTGANGAAALKMNGSRPNLNRRAMNVRANLTSALTKFGARAGAQDPTTNAGTVSSAGDVAHNAAAARNFFGVSGTGVKIGVLSDSVDFLAQSVASGNLPADVTVLPGQSGVPGIGEGTAMLEIIHDLAPGAKLFFATAFNGIQSFADNIRALRAAGCDIIVDDIIYFVESPFHDDIVSTAVEEVTADGALYFSSAGNEGNVNDGTSGTWEGDFKNSRTTLPGLTGGTLHDFGDGVISNRVEASSPNVLTLHWSDPLGASDNDYDFFILDNTLTTVLDASTTVQDGDDDPFEITLGAFTNERIIIFKADSAKRRALHLNNFRGQLAITTPGTIRGHAAAPGGYAVAAVDAAFAGGGSFTGGPTNPVELFSADGNRRVFFKSNGAPFTPGNLLFANNGGELRKKPDLTAADGVATSVPTFPSFFGTSAAAPHAAAIAALLKSAKPRLNQDRIRRALTKSALDIEAAGFDRDSGAGIVDAFGALLFIDAAPAPSLAFGAVTTTAVGGDGDNSIEPGEGGSLSIALTNVGGATALGVSATITTMTPGVTITNATSSYPNIGSNGQSATNITPLTFNLANNATCGVVIDFTATVNAANSNDGPQTLSFQVQTGQPNPTVVSYTGPPVVISSGPPSTITIPLEVSGLTAPIGDLNFSFDGSSCTSAIGATTVGLDHSWVGDLVITLTSPQGTVVTLMNQPGGPLNSGNNFCNTLLDDGATALIQAITIAGNPYTGSFRPASPLAAFNGQNGNGTWTLTVSDVAALDGGAVRAFSLAFTTFVCSSSPAVAGVRQ